MSKHKNRRPIPCFSHPIIETHCHLDYLDAEALTETLAAAGNVGVERIVTIAVSPGNLDTVFELSHANDGIWCTQGVHPHEAESFTDAAAATIHERMSDTRVLAVGEIGLDYHYDHADRKVQRTVFEQQLQIAVDTDMPIVVHTRDADEDTRAILANFASHLRRKGVIHSFTSGMDLATWCLEQDFYLGFNGITTFNSAENVREVVQATPMQQIVLETDAPYLTPVPYRGRPNAPCYLPFIAEKLAELKACDIETLLAQVYTNSCDLLFPEQDAETQLHSPGLA